MKWIILNAVFLLTSFFAVNNTKAVNLQFGLVGDYSIGDLNESVEYGFGGKAGIGFSTYNNNSNSIELALVGQISKFPAQIKNNADFQFLTAGIDLKLSYQQKNGSIFYLTIGAGYATTERISFTKIVSTNKTVKVPTYSENNFYVSPGIGMVLSDQAGIKPFVEIRFTDIPGTLIKDIQFFQFEFGLRLN